MSSSAWALLDVECERVREVYDDAETYSEDERNVEDVGHKDERVVAIYGFADDSWDRLLRFGDWHR